jgi:hypothetical protein
MDVSSVGMAFVLESGRQFPQGQILDDMQLNLKGARLTVKVIVMGRREAPGEQTVHIGMFSPTAWTMSSAPSSAPSCRRHQEAFDRQVH